MTYLTPHTSVAVSRNALIVVPVISSKGGCALVWDKTHLQADKRASFGAALGSSKRTTSGSNNSSSYGAQKTDVGIETSRWGPDWVSWNARVNLLTASSFSLVTKPGLM